MNPNLGTTTNFHKDLERHLHAYATQMEEDIDRLRLKVAFDRFLARMVAQESPSFFLKGGYGMELRIAHTRATEDMDLTYLKRVQSPIESMDRLILHELQTIACIELNDHFSYRVGLPEKDIKNAPYGGSRYPVTTNIGSVLFAEFRLDVGADFLMGSLEQLSGNDWLAFCGIPAPVIPMIPIEQQFAEKVHAYYTHSLKFGESNTRTKDIFDLLILLKIGTQTPEAFRSALSRVFKARNTCQLPITLPEPPENWDKPFAQLAAECDIEETLKSGFAKVAEFYSGLSLQNEGHRAIID